MRISNIIRKVKMFFAPQKNTYIMTKVTTNGSFVKAFIDTYSDGIIRPLYQFTDERKAAEAYEKLACM